MRTTRLYTPAQLQRGTEIALDKAASHHLIRVLRNKKGAEISLFNGDGTEYKATLLDENYKGTHVLIEQQYQPATDPDLEIILLQGISRSDRMDTTIQKSTELGVTKIIPVLCERTNTHLDKKRSDKKHEHWKNIAISACEQSGRCILPEISNQLPFNDALNYTDSDIKLVLHPVAEQGLKKINPKTNTIIILSGPEGGLSDQELEIALQHGFTAIHLGPRILRTETAAPACIAAIQVLAGDSG